MGTDNNGEWTSVIDSKSRWLDIDFRELWRYRDLVLLFVRRDFTAVYKQTVLGPLWFILQPLMTTLVFTVIFGNMAGLPTDGLPKVLFYLSGVVAWRYFADCLTKTSATLRSHSNIFGKVYFPRLAVPLSAVLSNLISFGLQFVIFLFFLAYYIWIGTDISPTGWVFIVPVLVLLMAMLGLGVGLLVTALTIRYRDLAFLVGFGVQLLMYASPVIYPMSMIPPQYRAYALLNPMTPIIETFRYAFLGRGTVSVEQLGVSAAIIVGILMLGLAVFSRVEKNFMDTV